MSYDSISIIYNPNSTGDSADNAKQLKSQLTKLFPKLDVKLHKTKHAGHAETLAFKLSSVSKNPLIISSSGDGGYNEVINGAMDAQKQGANPICAVLASGNANDHSRTLQADTLLAAIKDNRIKHIDLLKISIKGEQKTNDRYAHSYIGLGLTPVVAVELNKTKLNAVKELGIVLRTFYRYRPFKITHNGKVLKLDSIVFANIGEMAKVLTLSKHSKPDDGKFEVIPFQHEHKLRLLQRLLTATVSGLNTSKQASAYTFTTLKNMPAQLDGEVIKIKKNSVVTITSEHKLLKTII